MKNEKAWRAAIRAVCAIDQSVTSGGAANELGHAFGRKVVAPFLRKSGARYAAELFDFRSPEDEAYWVKEADDLLALMREPSDASGTAFSYWVPALGPHSYTLRNAAEMDQGYLDTIPYSGFEFTYGGQRYLAEPGIIHVCLNLTPDTDDPEVLAYLDCITPIWGSISELPVEFDPAVQ